MNRKIVCLATVSALSAGMATGALAADRFAPPKHPVPYSQLNAYMKGSEHQRASILTRSSDANAAANAGVNSAATTPPTPTRTTTPDAPAPVTPPAAAPATSPVNPPADVATPPTSPSTPPQ